MPGDATVLDLAPGIQLVAPGMTGEATTGAAPTAMPPVTATGQLFEHALGNAGLVRSGSPILLTHATAAAGAVHVTLPRPGPGKAAVLLVQDTTGAVSVHAPDGAAPLGHGPDAPAVRSRGFR